MLTRSPVTILLPTEQAHGGRRGGTFVRMNGVALTASDAELVVAILALAEGELDEDELADWFRQ